MRARKARRITRAGWAPGYLTLARLYCHQGLNGLLAVHADDFKLVAPTQIYQPIAQVSDPHDTKHEQLDLKIAMEFSRYKFNDFRFGGGQVQRAGR